MIFLPFIADLVKAINAATVDAVLVADISAEPS
jgi:hypothetical protein